MAHANILFPAQHAQFDRDGYVLVPELFDREEAALLGNAMQTDPAIRKHFNSRADSEGAVTKMVTWNLPGDSVYVWRHAVSG